MLTSRGRLVLALGPLLYVAAWSVGAQALYPVAVGLPLAAGLAWAWVYLLRGPMELHRVVRGGERHEGDDVEIDLRLLPEGRFTPSGVLVVERIPRVGTVEATLARRGEALVGRYVLPRLARGRYTYRESWALLEDPFGLARAAVPLSTAGSLLVYPRLVELDRVFSETGAELRDGRRMLLRRTSGFDLHSVREHQQGESLRRVHWRATAHRGRLMVKELEDEPRDEVAVVLDASAESVVGTPPRSSFDAQVRAAGSVLLAHARRGRRAVLTVPGAERQERRVEGNGADDWHRALELLASVEPARDVPAAAVTGGDGGAASRALELVVVTARLEPQLVERLAQRAVTGGGVALVYVHAASFARPSTAPVREPGLLRLQSLGVPVAVLRRGDDLLGALSGAALGEAVGG